MIISFINGQNNNSYSVQADSSLTLLSPQGAEVFDGAKEIVVEWDYKSINSLNIEISYDGIIWESKVANYPASERHFIIDRKNINSDKFLIRVIESESNKILDQTKYFTILKNQELLKKSSLNKSTSIQNLKLMPLGNSITAGYTIPVTSNLEGYRKYLYQKLLNNGLNFDFVGSKTNGLFSENQHEGHGGWHIKHWFGNKKYSLIDSLNKFLTLNPPDVILLHAGTNDIGELGDSRNNNTIDTIVTNLSEFLDVIYSFDPNIHVILARIINRVDNPSTTTIQETMTTTAYNNLLQSMADTRIANGDNLSVVDMESSLNYPADLSDGLHPNAAGYSKIAYKWFSSIREFLPKLSLKIYLEGAFNGSDDLQAQLTLPLDQPYDVLPWNYSGTEHVDAVPSGVIDWVLVSLRNNTTAASIVVKRAGFILNDGTIVDMDGSSPLVFPVDPGDYYVVVEHRNHLPVMSNGKVNVSP